MSVLNIRFSGLKLMYRQETSLVKTWAGEDNDKNGKLNMSYF